MPLPQATSSTRAPAGRSAACTSSSAIGWIRAATAECRHFSALQRGLPRMSPTLLSARLRTLVRAGVVERHQDGNRISYTLTPAGQELRPIVEALGQWAVRWIPELGDEHLDPHLLLWDMHRNVDRAAVPPGRTVLHLVFRDVPGQARAWWLVIDPDEVDVCSADPGHPVTATVETGLRTLTRIWLGDLSWSAAARTGDLVVYGEPSVRRAVPRWFSLSTFASVPRPVAAVG